MDAYGGLGNLIAKTFELFQQDKRKLSIFPKDIVRIEYCYYAEKNPNFDK